MLEKNNPKNKGENMKEDQLVLEEIQGLNTLRLFKLSNPRLSWSGGPMYHYGLSYLWRSATTGNVIGDDWSLVTRTEAKQALKIGLFKAFNLV